MDIVATGPSAADGLAKEMTFLTDLSDTVWVLFDMKCSPGGYAYLFVLDGVATLGCAITRDLSQINDYFERTLRRFQEISPFTISNEKTGYSFMDFSLKQSAVHHRKLYIGEAGGFQDYLFGLGLRYALMTGYFAAMSFIEGKDYDRLWKEKFGHSQAVSLVNRFLYEGGGNLGLSTFIRSGAGRDFKDYLTSWQVASLWKRLMVPVVKQVWQRKEQCRHFLLQSGLQPQSASRPTHWCRGGRSKDSGYAREDAYRLEVKQSSQRHERGVAGPVGEAQKNAT